MHATTVESLEIMFREYGSSESSQPAPAKVDFDQDSAHTGYGIEGLASFVNNNAMDHVVTALLR